jgi:hypothetical protein
MRPAEDAVADDAGRTEVCLVKKSGPAFNGVLHLARRVLAVVVLRTEVAVGIPGSVLCAKLGELRAIATA